MHREVFAGRDALLTVGEMPGVTLDDAVLFTDPARGEVDMVFQFEHVQLDLGRSASGTCGRFACSTLKASLGRWQAGLAERGWNSLYWDNHDQPRAVSRFGDDGEYRVESAKLLATILHLHRGTPYVYQGEELGMTNVPFAASADFRDIESLNYYAAATAAGADPDVALAALRARSRDNARTPMQWDDGTTRRIHHRRAVDSRESELRDDQRGRPARGSRFGVRALSAVIDLRHADPVVAFGDFAMLLPDDERIWAFTRTLGDGRCWWCNCSGEPADPGIDAGDGAGGADRDAGAGARPVGRAARSSGSADPLEHAALPRGRAPAPASRSAPAAPSQPSMPGSAGSPEQLPTTSSSTSPSVRVKAQIRSSSGSSSAKSPRRDGGLRVAQRDQPPVVVEDGVGVRAGGGAALISVKFGLTGSHGSPVVKPACAPSSHCTGVRALSRLRARRRVHQRVGVGAGVRPPRRSG